MALEQKKNKNKITHITLYIKSSNEFPALVEFGTSIASTATRNIGQHKYFIYFLFIYSICIIVFMWFFSGFMYHKSLESSQSPFHFISFHFISSGIGSTHVLAIELSSVFCVCVCVCVSLIYIFETQFEAQIGNKCVNSGRSNAQQQQLFCDRPLEHYLFGSARIPIWAKITHTYTHSHTQL